VACDPRIIGADHLSIGKTNHGPPYDMTTIYKDTAATAPTRSEISTIPAARTHPSGSIR
jgi:hypothetical protein